MLSEDFHFASPLSWAALQCSNNLPASGQQPRPTPYQKRTSCPTCRGASQCSRYLDANPRRPARALCHSQRNEEFPASWCTQFVFILASKTQVTLLHLSPSSNLISEIKNVLLKHITCESYLSFWLLLIRKKNNEGLLGITTFSVATVQKVLLITSKSMRYLLLGFPHWGILKVDNWTQKWNTTFKICLQLYFN